MKIIIPPGGGEAAIIQAAEPIWSEDFTYFDAENLAGLLRRLALTQAPDDAALLRRIGDVFSALTNDSAACIITTDVALADPHYPVPPAEPLARAESLLVDLLQAARNAAESCREHVPDTDPGAGDGDALFAAIAPFTRAAIQAPASAVRTAILEVTGEADQ